MMDGAATTLGLDTAMTMTSSAMELRDRGAEYKAQHNFESRPVLGETTCQLWPVAQLRIEVNSSATSWASRPSRRHTDGATGQTYYVSLITTVMELFMAGGHQTVTATA